MRDFIFCVNFSNKHFSTAKMLSMHKCENETFLNLFNIVKSTVLFEQVKESTFINYKFQYIKLLNKICGRLERVHHKGGLIHALVFIFKRIAELYQ